MGRKANPVCLYCAKNYRTEDEARQKHPECYVGHNCRMKIEGEKYERVEDLEIPSEGLIFTSNK